MFRPILVPLQSYDPSNLLDQLRTKLQLKNDAALSRLLDVKPPLLSKIRHRRQSVSASLIIRIHDTTGIAVRDLRDMMGDRRNKTRL